MRHAGIVFLGWVLMIPSASLADSWVAFDLRSPQAGTVIDNTGAQPPSIYWSIAVDVTGGNVGLAGYLFDLVIDKQGTIGSPAIVLPLPRLSRSFRVGNMGAPCGGRVNDYWSDGGPGLAVRSPGDNVSSPGSILGFGTAYPALWSVAPISVRMTTGVGRAEHADSMLIIPQAGFELHSGRIPTSGLDSGVYTVHLSARDVHVLDPAVDFTTDHPYPSEFTLPVSSENVSADSFTFTIVPEPGVLLLVAAGAALRRRRRRKA